MMFFHFKRRTWVKALYISVPVCLFWSAQKLAAARPHFFVRCVVLYGMPGSRRALDVTEIRVSPDNTTVAVCVDSPDPMDLGSLQFWDVATRKLLPDTKHYPWFSDALSFNESDSSYGIHRTPTGLTGVVDEKGFTLLNTRTKEIIRHLRYPLHAIRIYNDKPTTWTFSPDGKTLWWADEHQQIFWQSIE